ncbi:tripartite tricarboxylate transporter substrate binding protein [Roseomonas sp. GC11]|uniref:Bug family tripartite tricarboxylate transporter substrate binding protein n=1 Tax=Roseomonas sp. GC11 TaxID=2950546 RepID=UPI00210C32E3|nr:tripartite tricarboxylate transporter substrate binding protein [Roseomonas sp. GC11]MCQ4158620.1 tripartite tricarboxylate transporter substrate binding protein [Roseomonas sp. GC11]
MPRSEAHRRALLKGLGALAMAPLLATPARAQEDWPRRPLRLIVPQPPGGNLDLLVRAVAEGLRPVLGQPVVVENRSGGNGVIGLEACAQAAPDGYTFCAVNVEVMTILPFLEPQLFQRFASLQPVTQLATSPSVVLASLEAPPGDLRAFIAWARGRKGLNYASSGAGSTANLLWEWLRRREGIEIEHVPYRGVAEAIREVSAGRLQASYVAMAVAMPQIRAGRVRPLAVLGDQRHPDLPETPSMAELGYDFPYAGAWWGLCAPPETPAAIGTRLAAAVRQVVKDEEFHRRVLAPQYFQGVGGTPEAFASLIARDRRSGEALLNMTGVTAGN